MAKVIKGSQTLESSDAAPGEHDFGDSLPRHAAHIHKRANIEAKSERQRILDEAASTRDQMLQTAQEQAEHLRQQAQEEGYRAGKAEAVQDLQRLVAEATARFQSIEAQIEPQLRELAITIARRILGQELTSHPEAVVGIVKQALSDKAGTRREVYLRVHPEDYRLVKDSRSDLVEVLTRCKEIGIREDATVARHGVVIETEAGSIDAQLETQLEIFERVLLDVGRGR